MAYQFQQGIVAGTFDHLHAGHKQLLDASFQQAVQVSVYIATEELFAHKQLASVIEDYQIRQATVKAYLKQKGYLTRADFVALSDVYGDTLQNDKQDVIFVTDDTKTNAEKINKKRKAISLPPLTVVVVPFAKSTDGNIITSERIRLGQIDRDGNVYADVFENKSLLYMPNALREEMKKPAGKVMTQLANSQFQSSNTKKKNVIISIGDVISASLLEIGVSPAVQVIDGKTRRHVLNDNKMQQLLGKHTPLFTNRPGTINARFIPEFQKAITTFVKTEIPQTIAVDGEEDLLALPAMMLAPLKATVLYGLYDQGAVVVEITEKKKKEMKQLLTNFRF